MFDQFIGELAIVGKALGGSGARGDGGLGLETAIAVAVIAAVLLASLLAVRAIGSASRSS